MITDFFVAEPLIIARLQDQIQGVTRVLPAADLASLLDNKAGWSNVGTPAIYVGPYDYQLEDTPNPAQQKFAQRWYVLLVTRHVGQIDTGAGAREAAGPLLVSIIRALLGWLPGSGLGPLKLEQAGGRWAYRDGKLLHPLIFSTLFKLGA